VYGVHLCHTQNTHPDTYQNCKLQEQCTWCAEEHSPKIILSKAKWLSSVKLATQKVAIRRMAVLGQSGGAINQTWWHSPEILAKGKA
jgi:hypothetical protein